MNRLLLTIILGLLTTGLCGQALIDFNNDNSGFIEIDSTTSGNIWQIGPPNKGVFHVAYSPPNALVTDTLNPYPANNYSVAILDFEAAAGHCCDWYYLWFWSMIDTDFKLAGGIIEVSFDNGQSWVNFMNEPDCSLFMPEFVQLDIVEPLGELGFTGNYGGWKFFQYHCMVGLVPTTFRFVFASDSTHSGKDGWMIDNISTGGGSYHGINNSASILQFRVGPIPASNHLSIQSSKPIHGTIVLYNIVGAKVISSSIASSETQINLTGTPPGVYGMVVSNIEGTILHSQKIVIGGS